LRSISATSDSRYKTIVKQNNLFRWVDFLLSLSLALADLRFIQMDDRVVHGVFSAIGRFYYSRGVDGILFCSGVAAAAISSFGFIPSRCGRSGFPICHRVSRGSVPGRLSL
jgi:hypothetical protein